MCKKLKSLEEENNNLKTTNEKLQHQISMLQKMVFGSKTEKIIASLDEQAAFDELLKEVDILNPDKEPPVVNDDIDVKPHKKKRRNKKRSFEDIIPDNLPEEFVTIELPDDKLICKKTGEMMVKIGEERSSKLAVREKQYFKKTFIRNKYAVQGNSSSGVKTAPAPNFAIPGGNYDESFIAKIVCDRVLMHIPFYRIEEDLKYMGFHISRQTLNKLYMQAADVLRPIYDLMKLEMFKRGVLFTDDTPVKLQMPGTGKLKEGRMWVYVAGGKGARYTLFDFTVDRQKKRPFEFLKGFKGYIHADAYSGYDCLFEQEGVYECACWMHIRRKFFEAEDAPKELRDEVLKLIRRIYLYEKIIKKRPPELRIKVRQELTRKTISDILSITQKALTQQQVLPDSRFGKAISYLHNLGDAVYTFTEDERLSPDNGESERSLRPLTIGRKNWMFAGSAKGGQATGILTSLVQTCKKEDINPREYITDVLRRISDHPVSKLHELLPNSQWQPLKEYY